MQTKAIVFFDDTCSFCKSLVYYLQVIDKKKKLLFAPLDGKTAKELISPLRKLNTVVFYVESGEKKHIYLYMKAVLRILFEVGGFYTLIGWKYILPKWLIDPFYKWIVKYRDTFQLTKNYTKDESFLP